MYSIRKLIFYAAVCAASQDWGTDRADAAWWVSRLSREDDVYVPDDRWARVVARARWLSVVYRRRLIARRRAEHKRVRHLIPRP